jgi:predicted dinucleotide-binding enzyme
MMTIGIIGGDERAVAIGRMFSSCGHAVTFSDPTPSNASEHAAQALGGNARASTPYEQASTCEALILAVHWEHVDDALRALGDYKDGLLIDATRPPQLWGTSGAEMLARKLDNRHVVKAFVDNLEPGRPIRVASDDPEARAAVKATVGSCGGIVEDLGPLAGAIEIERSYASEAPTNS